MPSREISRDELSMLLMVYLGMGSDIMELLVLFEEDYVLEDDIAIYATLVVWTVSLLQFTVVLTTKSEENKSPAADVGDQSCRTVKVTDTEPYYIRAVPATKASLHSDKDTTVYIG